MRNIRQILLLALTCLPLVGIAQKKKDLPRYEFLKQNDKPKYLREFDEIRLSFHDTMNAEKTIVRSHWVTGRLIRTTPDSIVVDLESEDRNLTVWDDQFRTWMLKRDGFYTLDQDTILSPRAFDRRMLDQVVYRRRVSGLGGAIAGLSFAALLIYAPLKAMYFRTGTFDGERYIRVATHCLIGIGLGIVIAPFTDGTMRLHLRSAQ